MSDTAPDIKVTTVHDHPFEPKGEWWSLCKHCNLGRASHSWLLAEGSPPWDGSPREQPTDTPEPDPEEDDLPIHTNEDTMLDAQLHATAPDRTEPLHEQLRPTLTYERVTKWLDEINQEGIMSSSMFEALGERLHKWWEAFR